MFTQCLKHSEHPKHIHLCCSLVSISYSVVGGKPASERCSEKVPLKNVRTFHALDGVAQWTECWPVNQRVTISIPSQGTCLGCRPGPQLGCTRGNHTLMFLSLFFSLPFPLPCPL